MPDEKIGFESEDGRSGWQAEDDPRAWVTGGKRCAIAPANIEGWWVGISPRNGPGAWVEGPWEHWVELARGILAADEAWRAVNAPLSEEQRPGV